ncbi:hypothetical protein [Micromonospora avicenniae]|uniref:Uncharacterized protein n=1 Tax=Micromonospora avicenniae TaxID=1198245 RepID=A0A1N6PSN0_9ACTN|nr:hypothetical protein [Micromonospora avicenniae]SIQ07326.1 hypothetical protein SAMN05444858_1018 [Micromonospora avicenniae]
MARDVEVDVLLRDKTGTGVNSVERNLKRANTVQGRVLSQMGKGFRQWENGFKRVGGAANRWANSGDSAGKKFVRGISKGIGKLADLGGTIGGALSKGISGAGPQVALAAAGLAVVAATAAAPAIAGAIVGGAGIGGVVGGVLLASKDARVASAMTGLKEEIGTGLQDAAKRFVPATLDAVKRARAAFRGLVPDLRQIFDVSATWLGPLTTSLGRAAQLALDGITKAVTKAGPIIAVIGRGAEKIGQRVGELFSGLSDNGASMAAALDVALSLVAGAIQEAGIALNFLVEAFEFFVNKIPFGKKWLDGYKNSSDGAKSSSLNLAGGFRALATDANAAAAGLTNAKQKSDDFVNANISLARAQIASRDAVKNTTAAIKENANAKLTNKQRADANMTALLNLADAFNTEADAGDRSGVSAGKAAAAYSTNRAKLIAMAEKAGYSRQKAEELAAQLLKVPKNVNTDVNVNTSTAMGRLETLQKKIKNTKGKTVTLTVQVLSNGNHRMPGGGQLTFSDYTSWAGAGGSGVSRTGGPTRVESTVNQTLNVLLDGQPFRSYTDRAIAESERRQNWRQKVGRR